MTAKWTPAGCVDFNINSLMVRHIIYENCVSIEQLDLSPDWQGEG